MAPRNNNIWPYFIWHTVLDDAVHPVGGGYGGYGGRGERWGSPTVFGSCVVRRRCACVAGGAPSRKSLKIFLTLMV